MKKLSLIEASRFTSPNPVSLICTRTPSGVTNLGTDSSWPLLSLEPEMIGFAMMKPSYTGEMVRESRQVVLTVPGEALAKQVMQCGSSTGRTRDKAKDFHVALTDIPDSNIQIPVHSVVAMQCELREYVEVGDHYFYICHVKNVYANEDETPLFAWKGYARVAPAKEA